MIRYCSTNPIYVNIHSFKCMYFGIVIFCGALIISLNKDITYTIYDLIFQDSKSSLYIGS